MPKYDAIESNPENDVAWVLQLIANELAEKNRLTRVITLRTQLPFPNKTKEWKGDLEDQA